MKQNSKSLKTLSIIFIIFGSFETFLGVFGGVAGLNEELWQQVSEVTSDLGSYVLLRNVYLFITVMFAICGLFMLIAGISGVRASADPSKAKGCMTAGIVHTVIRIACFIITIVGTRSFPGLFSIILIGLAIIFVLSARRLRDFAGPGMGQNSWNARDYMNNRYGQEPPQQNGWQTPAQPPQQNGWQTPAQPPQQNGWQTPAQPPQQNGWQTPAQPPQQNGWQTPAQPPQQNGWQTPAQPPQQNENQYAAPQSMSGEQNQEPQAAPAVRPAEAEEYASRADIEIGSFDAEGTQDTAEKSSKQ